MAYIINTSTVAAVTLNLSQGRVRLEPQQYCELHDQDLDKARTYYNNKDLNLYVANTDKELELILETKHQKTEKVNAEVIKEAINEAVVVSDRPLPIPTVDNAEQSADGKEDVEEIEKEEESKENAEDDSIHEPYIPVILKDPENNILDEKEDIEEIEEVPAEEETKEEEDQTAKLAKENLQTQIEILRETNNLDGLKDLATKLSVPYTHNIKAETLANKLLDYLK